MKTVLFLKLCNFLLLYLLQVAVLISSVTGQPPEMD